MIPGTCLEYSEMAQSTYVMAKRRLYSEIKSRDYGITFYWPRIFYAFSAIHQRPRILREALNARKKGSFFELKYPNEQHDYIEMMDVGLQLKSVLDVAITGTWDIGTGVLHSNRELVEQLGFFNVSVPSNSQEVVDPRVADSWNFPAREKIPNHECQIENTVRYFSRISM